MAFRSGITIYVYTSGLVSVSFGRKMDEDVTPWFFAEDQYTKDPVLPLTTVGGANISTAYMDLGAAVAPPLLFRASCLSAADRYALKNLRRTTGVLTSTNGPFSGTVLFFKAIPVNTGNYSRWWLDVGFELVP